MGVSGLERGIVRVSDAGQLAAGEFAFPPAGELAAQRENTRQQLAFWLGRLYGVTVILLLLGLACSFSTSVYLHLARNEPPYGDFIEHGVFSLLGIGVMAFTLALGRMIRPVRRWLGVLIPLVWALSWLLVLAVAVTPLGVVVNGSRRWLDLGFVMFQPSELLKISVVLYLAQLLCWFRQGVPLGTRPADLAGNHEGHPRGLVQGQEPQLAAASASPLARAWFAQPGTGGGTSNNESAGTGHTGKLPDADAALRSFRLSPERRPRYPAMPVQCLLIILLSAGLTGMQPDLGTTAIIMGAGLMTMLLARVRMKDLLSLGLVLLFLVAVVAVVKPGKFGYAMERIQTWMNPRAQEDGEGYQITQSRGAIALGSGGWLGLTGRGFLRSEQKMNRLPYSELEFVYPVMVEELGFAGGVLIIALFGWLAYVALRLSRLCRDPFSRVSIAALGFSIALQAFVNIATTLGTFPLTGITLPFLSGGGTSLLVSMTAISLMAMLAAAETGRGSLEPTMRPSAPG